MKKILTVIFINILLYMGLSAKAAKPQDNLQAILDSGADLVLQKSTTYELKETLHIKKENQKIYTENAKTVSEYACLKLTGSEVSRAVNMLGIKGAQLEHILFDGNRYAPARNIKNRESLVQAGGHKGDNQIVRNCAFINARGWSLLHFFEPAKNALVENNFMFGSGVDCRGSGASKLEEPFPWGDGISFAAQASIVRNNFIIDPTDVGIVAFSAPNTLVEDNVIAAISREALGAVNMVDSIKLYENPEGSKRYTYEGLIVKNNLADAKGARVHIAYPVGVHIWGPGENAGKSGKIVFGGTVIENEAAGKCAGYGFAISGAENFKVQNNKSGANYSRLGDGLTYKRPDEPTAFIYDAESVKNCELQSEFIKSEKTLIHLLACNFGKRRGGDASGWRIYQYGASEALGVVETAYLEMLGRAPNVNELENAILYLDAEKAPADDLRKKLMQTKEFQMKHPKLTPDDLHNFRTQKWLKAFDSAQKSNKSAGAKELYKKTWELISSGKF